MKIGSLIKAIRKEKGISAYYIAKESGITKGYISQIETGKFSNPSVKTLHKILSVIGISEQEFFRKLNDGIEVSIILAIGLTVSTWGLL